MRRRSGTVTPTSAGSANAIKTVAASPAGAAAWRAKPPGSRRMRARNFAHEKASTKEAGSALHLRFHAAVSAARSSEAGERSTPPRREGAEAKATTKAGASRSRAAEMASAWPTCGSATAGRASGGPTARAPHEGQPSDNSPPTLAPQHGQIVNSLAPQKGVLNAE